jgi:hypothetical protein
MYTNNAKQKTLRTFRTTYCNIKLISGQPVRFMLDSRSNEGSLKIARLDQYRRQSGVFNTRYVFNFLDLIQQIFSASSTYQKLSTFKDSRGLSGEVGTDTFAVRFNRL